MDCRKTLLLALGLLAPVGGCTYPFTALSVKNSESAKVAEEGGHKAPTYLAFGDFRAASGFAKEHSPAQQKQFREDAKQAYLKAIEIDAKFLPAYVALARLLQGCDDYPGAVAVLERALQVNSQDPSLWNELGMCQCRAKNWGPAIESLRKASLIDPNNRQYGTTLGFALARAGRYDESYAALRRCSGEAKAHADLARMLRHLGQNELARRHATIAAYKDPSQKEARALLDELNGKAPAGQRGAIQTAGYNRPATATPGAEPGQVGTTSRPIRIPPLPVISITRAPSEGAP
jgi:tetratricopeptide (TPR) repeat protein